MAGNKNGKANGHGKLNGAKPSKTKPEGATELAKIDAQQRAVELFLEGKSPEAIAQQEGKHIATIYRYLQAARCELLREKKDHFDQRLAILLDSKFNQLEAHATLLGDVEFLRTADPERISVLSRSSGILTDKCFTLLAAFGGRSAQPAQQPVE